MTCRHRWQLVSELDLSGLVLITAVAFIAPLVLGLAPAFRLPSVVLEIVAGIAIGPSGFGWVEVDQPIEVLALIGLAFLLFLSGLEIDFEKLRGRQVGLAGLGFAVSFGLAVVVGLVLTHCGPGGGPIARRDHPGRDVARRRRPGAQGRGTGRPRSRASSSSRPPRSPTSAP